MSENHSINNDIIDGLGLTETVNADVEILIGVTKKVGKDKVAVTMSEYDSLDKRKYTTDGVILRNTDLGINLMVAPDEDRRWFGIGPDSIPEGDSRRDIENPVMADLDGKWRTEYLLQNHAFCHDDNCAVCYCNDYGDGWWLPSGGEMELIRLNKDSVDEAMGKIGGKNISFGVFWVSTQYSDDYSWHLDTVTGEFGFWKSKGLALFVRPVTDASEYVKE